MKCKWWITRYRWWILILTMSVKNMLSSSSLDPIAEICNKTIIWISIPTSKFKRRILPIQTTRKEEGSNKWYKLIKMVLFRTNIIRDSLQELVRPSSSSIKWWWCPNKPSLHLWILEQLGTRAFRAIKGRCPWAGVWTRRETKTRRIRCMVTLITGRLYWLLAISYSPVCSLNLMS